MNKALENRIRDSLRAVKIDGGDQDIVALNMVNGINIADMAGGAKVTFALEVDPQKAAEMEPLRLAAEQAVKSVAGVAKVTAVLTAHRPAQAKLHLHEEPENQVPLLANVKHIIAVASGKGGVGKSTTAVNLAVAMTKQGHNVGLLDADIYGPSVPRMLGMRGKPELDNNDKLIPFQVHGLSVMSIGNLIPEETPVIWRGPMVHGALRQLLADVSWGELDVLVIDMPPGTGDAPLTLAHFVPLSGVVIVSTPQDVALLDARKAIGLFQKLNVPILGIIENMSQFVCPHCGGHSEIFGHGGARAEAERMSVPLLGEVPLDVRVRTTSDEGTPIVALDPANDCAQVYNEMAMKVWGRINI